MMCELGAVVVLCVELAAVSLRFYVCRYQYRIFRQGSSILGLPKHASYASVSLQLHSIKPHQYSHRRIGCIHAPFVHRRAHVADDVDIGITAVAFHQATSILPSTNRLHPCSIRPPTSARRRRCRYRYHCSCIPSMWHVSSNCPRMTRTFNLEFHLRHPSPLHHHPHHAVTD